MFTKKEKNNFKESIADLNKTIKSEEKEYQIAKKCLEYFHPDMNYYDEKIEEAVRRILDFYTNDVKETLDFNISQKKHFEKVLERGHI